MAIGRASTVALVVILTTATITDVRRREVPAWLTFGGIVTGLLTSATAGWDMLRLSLLGLVIGSLLLAPFVWRGGFGAADALLLGVIGAWKGWQFTLWTAWWTALLGAVLACVTWSRGRQTFPYVPAIALGALIAAAV